MAFNPLLCLFFYIPCLNTLICYWIFMELSPWGYLNSSRCFNVPSFILCKYIYLLMFLIASFYQFFARNFWRFSDGTVVGSAYQCRSLRSLRRCGFDPWVRKIRGSGKWQPTPVFLEASTDTDGNRWGHKELEATEQACMHIQWFRKNTEAQGCQIICLMSHI